MERDAHNDLKKRPTPQKHDDIFVFPYVGAKVFLEVFRKSTRLITWQKIIIPKVRWTSPRV